MDVLATLGRIDIYLLDQVMRCRVPSGARILDAGCGTGRNLRYFLLEGYDVAGVDKSPEAIERTRSIVGDLGSPGDVDLRTERIEDLSFEDASFDFVICSAVLHFSDHEEHFVSMVRQLHRVLAPGGTCFCRLASNIGLEDRIVPQGEAVIPGWYRLPDGSDRFLVDQAFLEEVTGALGARLADPIKTVNVQHQRCMTNWVWQKGA